MSIGSPWTSATDLPGKREEDIRACTIARARAIVRMVGRTTGAALAAAANRPHRDGPRPRRLYLGRDSAEELWVATHFPRGRLVDRIRLHQSHRCRSDSARRDDALTFEPLAHRLDGGFDSPIKIADEHGVRSCRCDAVHVCVLAGELLHVPVVAALHLLDVVEEGHAV